MKKIISSILLVGVLVGANAGGLQERYEENCKYFNIKPVKMTDDELKTLVPKMDAKRAKVDQEKKVSKEETEKKKLKELYNKINVLNKEFAINNSDIKESEFTAIARSYLMTADIFEKIILVHNKKDNKLEFIVNQGRAMGKGEVFTKQYGTLQNVVKSLEMPSGTIQISHSWENIFNTYYNNVSTLKTKKDLYHMTYQLLSLRTYIIGGEGMVSVPNEIKEGSLAPLMLETAFSGNSFKEIYKHEPEISDVFDIPFMWYDQGSQASFQKAIMHLLLFHSIIDKASNGNYAKKYFTEKGFAADWGKMERVITFLDEKGL